MFKNKRGQRPGHESSCQPVKPIARFAKSKVTSVGQTCKTTILCIDPSTMHVGRITVLQARPLIQLENIAQTLQQKPTGKIERKKERKVERSITLEEQSQRLKA